MISHPTLTQLTQLTQLIMRPLLDGTRDSTHARPPPARQATHSRLSEHIDTK